MAVSPPGDIVLDVLKAADPARLREARQALASGAAPAAETRQQAAAEFDRAYAVSMRERFEPQGAAAQERAMRDSYKEFEAMVLQNFVKSMLPQDATETFGEGMAGEIWKSMMAEQLGAVIAEKGGIGIARQLLADSDIGTGGRRAAPDLGGPAMAEAMLQELERSTVEAWGDETAGEDAGTFWNRG